MDTSDKVRYTITYGTYYNPAGKHYGSLLANCVCDNCGKHNLKICIGWDTCDVCLPCAEHITNSLHYISLDGKRGTLPPGAMCGF